MKKFLIVGGVAGGATVAARLRRLNEADEIILCERDEYISFANCGLPYYIGDVIQDRERLLVLSAEEMAERFQIDVRNMSEVTAIDRETSSVTIHNRKTGEIYQETFDHLILSPGAKPMIPPIKGLKEAQNVFALRNVPDTDKIKAEVNKKKPKRAIVIGGGFIGIEMAENLKELGLNVTIVEKQNQVFAPLDFEMAQIVHQTLNANGVNLILGDGVDHFEDEGKKVVLESGEVLVSDMTILSIGVAPENHLAQTAGLKLGAKGHIMTDESFTTLDAETDEPVKNISAVGDAVEVLNFVDGSKTAIPLAWVANRQARVLADYISKGKPIHNRGFQGTSGAKVFNMEIAGTGKNEKALKAAGLPYQVIHAHRSNHAGYYPGATSIALKLLYNPENGMIYGMQAVGQDGTVKRVDVVATVMRTGGSVYDLSDLELVYAPPFSSAKDPINILGYIAENIQDGMMKTYQWYELDEQIAKGAYILDVRTDVEIMAGKIEQAVHIPIAALRGRLDELPEDLETPIYLYCNVGHTSYMAVQILNHAGYTNVHNLSGGYTTYKLGHYQLAPLDFSVQETEQEDQPVINPLPTGDVTKTINVAGLQCPGPLMATYKSMEDLSEGQTLKIIATDFGFVSDIKAWCATNGHTLLSQETKGNDYIATIQKGQKSAQPLQGVAQQQNATMVVFSGDLDKAIAAMIIAQGAAAQGKDVTIFFTFWGLNVLRKKNPPKLAKPFVEKMFSGMMPKGATKLTLSTMKMWGMGTKMIKSVMKRKNVDDLETMMRKCQEAGVRFIACTMSMDLMGLQKEDLIDDIDYAGVASYIAANENAGTTLFI